MRNTVRTNIGTQVAELQIGLPSSVLRLSKGKPPARSAYKEESEWSDAMSSWLQDAVKAVDDAIQAAATCPLFARGGHLEVGVTFTKGSNTVVRHGLGRPYKGWLLASQKSVTSGFIPVLTEVDNSTSADPRRKAELDSSQLTLTPSDTGFVGAASFVGDIWVY